MRELYELFEENPDREICGIFDLSSGHPVVDHFVRGTTYECNGKHVGFNWHTHIVDEPQMRGKISYPSGADIINAAFHTAQLGRPDVNAVVSDGGIVVYEVTEAFFLFYKALSEDDYKVFFPALNHYLGYVDDLSIGDEKDQARARELFKHIDFSLWAHLNADMQECLDRGIGSQFMPGGEATITGFIIPKIPVYS